MHRVAVVAYEGVVALEVATVLEVFSAAGVHAGRDLYEVGMAGPDDTREPLRSTTLAGPSLALTPDRALSWVAGADTVVVPAHSTFLDPPPPAVGAALLDARARGARVASLCLGAFALASVGLLDGRAATTHWRWSDELARRHPAVRVQREKLFVCDDGVCTAAGVTAALDLALHLVEQDHGADLAAATARFMVAPMRREGGQAQFVEYTAPEHTSALHDTMHWAEAHLDDDLTLPRLARHARMSTRTFSRRFRAATGTTPSDWLTRTRVRRAQQLLQSTDWPVDRIGRAAGFRSDATFRHHFGRIADVTPARYRRTFGTSPTP